MAKRVAEVAALLHHKGQVLVLTRLQEGEVIHRLPVGRVRREMRSEDCVARLILDSFGFIAEGVNGAIKLTTNHEQLERTNVFHAEMEHVRTEIFMIEMRYPVFPLGSSDYLIAWKTAQEVHDCYRKIKDANDYERGVIKLLDALIKSA
mgnify:CR=1 FL=1